MGVGRHRKTGDGRHSGEDGRRSKHVDLAYVGEVVKSGVRRKGRSKGRGTKSAREPLVVPTTSYTSERVVVQRDRLEERGEKASAGAEEKETCRRWEREGRRASSERAALTGRHQGQKRGQGSAAHMVEQSSYRDLGRKLREKKEER